MAVSSSIMISGIVIYTDDDDAVLTSVFDLLSKSARQIEAECVKRIRIETSRQCIPGELANFNARFQRYFDNGSEHRLGSGDNFGGREQLHSVN